MIKSYILSCITCALANKFDIKKTVPETSRSLGPDRPRQYIYCDLIPMHRGVFSYILFCLDAYSHLCNSCQRQDSSLHPSRFPVSYCLDRLARSNLPALLQDVPQNSVTQHGWRGLILLGRGKQLLYMGQEFAPSGTEVFRNHLKFPAIFTKKKGRMAWWDQTQFLWITIPVLYP